MIHVAVHAQNHEHDYEQGRVLCSACQTVLRVFDLLAVDRLKQTHLLGWKLHRQMVRLLHHVGRACSCSQEGVEGVDQNLRISSEASASWAAASRACAHLPATLGC